MQKFLRGQIWGYNDPYAKAGVSITTSVQRGNRPVVIVGNDVGNKHGTTVNVVPCTSQDKVDMPTHYTFTMNGIKNTVMCEQITTVDMDRLYPYYGTLSSDEMRNLDKCLFESLFFGVAPSVVVKSTVADNDAHNAETKNEQKVYNAVKKEKRWTVRTAELRNTIMKEYFAANTYAERVKIANKYGFTNTRMLSQYIKRWKNKEKAM